MELRHLRYFVAVAEELHFGRAAQRLNMAQPPLSQQIRSLETELGVQLFLRTSRTVSLTPEGRFFLEHAQTVIAHAHRAFESMQAAGRGEAGRLSIGFVTSSVYALVPSALREFHRRLPAVEIRCFEMLPQRQIEALKRREIDVGFSRSAPTDEVLAVETLSREPLVLAMPSEHPLAKERKLRLRALAAEPFILFPRSAGPAFYDAIMSTCRRAGFAPRLGQEPGEWQTVLALVAAGLGVALVPDSLKNWQRPGVVYRELLGQTAEVELNLLWRKQGATPVIEKFLHVAREVARAGAGPSRRGRTNLLRG